MNAELKILSNLLRKLHPAKGKSHIRKIQLLVEVALSPGITTPELCRRMRASQNCINQCSQQLAQRGGLLRGRQGYAASRGSSGIPHQITPEGQALLSQLCATLQSK